MECVSRIMPPIHQNPRQHNLAYRKIETGTNVDCGISVIAYIVECGEADHPSPGIKQANLVDRR